LGLWGEVIFRQYGLVVHGRLEIGLGVKQCFARFVEGPVHLN